MNKFFFLREHHTSVLKLWWERIDKEIETLNVIKTRSHFRYPPASINVWPVINFLSSSICYSFANLIFLNASRGFGVDGRVVSQSACPARGNIL
jgi:hypothetical protein